jgi:hypothetical protein
MERMAVAVPQIRTPRTSIVSYDEEPDLTQALGLSD